MLMSQYLISVYFWDAKRNENKASAFPLKPTIGQNGCGRFFNLIGCVYVLFKVCLDWKTRVGFYFQILK